MFKYQTILSPLDQFEIRNLFSIDTPLLANMNLSITNIGLYMTIAAFIAFYFSILATNHSKITPNKWSLSQETLYATIHSIVVNQINNKNGQAYFPFMYTLFIFILINNLIGMVREQYLYNSINNNNDFKIISQRCKRDNGFKLNSVSLITSNWKVPNKKAARVRVNLYSTLSDNNHLNKDSSSLVINPHYLTGFIDGEGCFNISILKNNELSTGWQIIPTFQISLHAKDKELLELIQKSLGVGRIYKHGPDSFYYRIFGLNNLSVIIKHLDSFPLLTQKQADYILFKQVVELMNIGEHLTQPGILKIIHLKASINRGLPDKLKEEWLNITPANRPTVLSSPIKDKQWLVGFVEGEGSFQIVTQKIKDKIIVSLRFTLTQHIRDNILMKSLVEYLGCGRYITTANRKEVYFTVSNKKDINNIIIPLFQKYPLLGSKQQDFLDFVKVSELLKSKAHLTEKGLELINAIKSDRAIRIKNPSKNEK